jgi:molecular chaperone HscB
MDAFDTLGVEPRFDLDLGALEARHRALSGALHPDRYAGKPAGERRMALGKAIEVNDAWRVLRDPVRRAECLFARAGVAVGETREPKPSPDLLMEMLEIREELAAAHKKRDAHKVAALGEGMRAREREALGALQRGFASAGGDTAKLATVLPELGKLRYVRRFFEELEAIEDDLLHGAN